MENLSVHIVLPKGLRLTTGAVLDRELTFSVVSQISPFYCSVEQVRLAGGTYLNKLSDLTIAYMIYEVSKDADSYSYSQPEPSSDPNSQKARIYQMWLNARQNWVTTVAARTLIQNLWDIAGTKGSKTLANFSVSHVSLRDDGLPKRINDLQAEADEWLVVLKSGGQVGPGGRAPGRVAQKGVYNGEVQPGRLWVTTGMGANAKTLPGYGSTQAPVKYSSSPFWTVRNGRYLGCCTANFVPTI